MGANQQRNPFQLSIPILWLSLQQQNSWGKEGCLALSFLSSNAYLKLVKFMMKIDQKKMKGEGGRVPSLVSYVNKLGRRLTANINCVLSYNINMYYIIHT